MPRLINLSNLPSFQAVTLLSDPGYSPGPRIIPNCALVRLNWTLTDGKVGHNILHAAYTGTPALSATVAQTIFTSLTTGANWTSLAAFLASTAALASVTVLDLRSATATEFQSTGTAVPGTSASAAFPDEVAAVVTLRTANRGPSGRGRMYVPAWANNAGAAGGVISAPAIAALGTWFGINVFGGIASGLGPMVLALPHRIAYTSPITGRQFPDRPATTVVVTAGSIRDNHWDSARKRGLK